MPPVRPSRRATITMSLLAGGMLLWAAHAVTHAARAEAAPDTKPASAAPACTDMPDLAVLASPLSPWKGAPLHVVITSDAPLDGELTLIAPDGSAAVTSRERLGGPPYSWKGTVPTPAAGTWHARLALDRPEGRCTAVSREVNVGRSQRGGPGQSQKSVWPIRGAWDRGMENLYAVWIETLFDDPLDASPSWPALHEVLRDRSRNLLFNHLGLREDEKGHAFTPDCADLPYFLRGYFAFKMGLPFGFSKCTRGGRGKPPRCFQWWNIEKLEPPPEAPQTKTPAPLLGLFGAPAPPPPKKQKPKPQGLAATFADYMGTAVANTVHSGSGRVPSTDDSSDYYALPITPETLRPGTVYIDPYGHILVIVRRIAQTDATAGVLLAVDGQPDGTIARKRFWRGNFLFAEDPALGSPGFKRFRPVVRDKSGQRRLNNAEIAKHAAYGDFSLEQSGMAIDAFYDRMDDVLSPEPLDPERAMREAITALEEQLKARVTSVENGRAYQNKGGREVAMPDGAAIFETTGPWEDFATPSRDLRLLIAIDVVRGFPDRVARRPERYAMPKEESAAGVKAALERTLASELAARSFTYTRSDGSPWTLSLKDAVERAAALEMAYNLNDCVELRWGAAEGSTEAAPCTRRASDQQRKKMSDYRAWFQERRRPPRG